MTTAYNLTNLIIRTCKKSSSISTSIIIIRIIFKASLIKKLSILVAINIYNYYISRINIANQLQAAFIILQSQNLYY